MLASLPRPDRGILICGMAAYTRLRHLAATALTQSDAKGTVTPARVFEALRKLVIQRFIFDNWEIDTRRVEKVMAAAVREAKRNAQPPLTISRAG